MVGNPCSNGSSLVTPAVCSDTGLGVASTVEVEVNTGAGVGVPGGAWVDSMRISPVLSTGASTAAETPSPPLPATNMTPITPIASKKGAET